MCSSRGENVSTVTIITLNGVVQDVQGLPDGYDYYKIDLDDDNVCECEGYPLRLQIPYEWDGKMWCLSCGNFIAKESEPCAASDTYAS